MISSLGALRRAGVLLSALGVVGFAAGCSNSPSTPSAHVRGSTTTVPPTTSTSTTGPGTGTTSAASSRCQPSQLQFSPGQNSGAAGTLEVGVNLLNTSSTTCQLMGYPGMQLLSASAQPITTTVVFGGGPQFPVAAANAAPALVTLAPQQGAAFFLSYSDVPTGTETTCPTSAKAEVTPPNDTAYAVVTLAIGPCDNGTVHVSPVFAGSAS